MKQLEHQNNGETWFDCNLRAHPRPHRWQWVGDTADGYGKWSCDSCPVRTRVRGPGKPEAFLLQRG